MTKKALITIATILCLSVSAYSYWKAQAAKNTSDNNLTKFKKIESFLIPLDDSTKHNGKGIGAIRNDSAY